jgi:CHAT domain-containing protein/tetratricopeptide (TPR) repeat protein
LRATRQFYGEGDWRVTDSRLDLEDCRLLARLEGKQRQQLRQAEQRNQQVVQLWQQGRSKEALPLAQKALAARLKVLGEKHRATAQIWFNLGAQYQVLGRSCEALRCYLAALRVRKEVQGEQHPDHASGLKNLAVLYQEMGEHHKALPLLEQALRITRQVQGSKHPAYADSLNSLAALHRALGEYGKALTLSQQALTLTREALGEKHPAYATSLGNLALLHKEQRRVCAAAVLFGQALAVQLAHAQDTLGAVDDRQRLLLLDQVSFWLSWFLTTAEGSDLAEGEVYRWVLGVKGVLASASRSGLDRLARDDPKVKRLLRELQIARAGLARLARTIPGSGAVASWRERFDRLEASKRQAQEQLAQASPQFARWQHRPSATEVAATLPADTALVEFVSYKHYLRYNRHRHTWLVEPKLLAFVLRQGRPIVLIPLGKVAAFTARVRAWRGPLLSGRPTAPDFAVAAWLSKHLWEPLEKHLVGVNTVLISPDGELANLPFAALPGKKPGSFLVEQYAFGCLPSGRQLLDVPAAKPADGLLALGGISFGESAKDQRAWADLPGTTLEVEQVERLFRARFPASPARCLSGNADRATLLSALTPNAKRRFGYLHLATHGYFEPVRTAGALPAAAIIAGAATPGLAGPMQALAAFLAADDPNILDRNGGFDLTGRTSRITGRNPMLTTGLVLANANRTGPDGVLSAEEIAGLDLRGCDLAMLSACQTALGKQEGYQGVLGLQHAFHTAGARHVLASLWSVSDPATSVLMEHFYTQLWQKKQPPIEALPQAQLFVLHNPARVRQRAEELAKRLVKRGVARQTLASRGFGDIAEVGKVPPAHRKGERSPVAWWAAWVVSGSPRRP